MRQLRIGVTGTESSHVDAVLAHVDAAAQPARASVTALAGGRTARNLQLAERAGIEAVIEDPAELIGLVDAVIVCERDGSTHLTVAGPLLAAGLGVLVDKPLACTVNDAQALVAMAAKGQALLTSFTPLRYEPDMAELMNESAELRATQQITALAVRGPADPHSQYGGLHWYGSHHADLAAAVLPGPIESVEVCEVDEGLVATAQIGGRLAELTFVRPDPTARIGFTVQIFGADSSIRREIRTGPEFFRPGLAAFFTMLRTGIQPIAPADLIRPVRLLQAITDRLD